jgi:2-polyprenyl-3-methyl-5-hydroxy-6-metoxy-1,4-benzoquinol methylase
VSGPLLHRLAGGTRQVVRRAILGATSAITGRHAVLLPAEAADDRRIFAARGPYRVTGDTLTVRLDDSRSGVLSIGILAYEGFFPSKVHWSGTTEYRGAAALELSFISGELSVDGEAIGVVPLPLPSRRFSISLRLTERNGAAASRTTGHYLDVSSADDDGRYYRGDDYVDYEAQSAGEHDIVLGLMRELGASGPVLDVGSATGGLVKRLVAEGFDAWGLEQSEWAVSEAARQIQPARVLQCDIETSSIPAEIANAGPFGTVVLWAVYEHFRNPPAVLSKVSGVARSGSTMLVNTTNAKSFSRLIFGEDWEGHFDWTHHGVESVTPESLAEALDISGWDVLSVRTHSFWHGSMDPESAMFRELYANDARFRTMLEARGLGDFLVCTARKR